MIYFKLTLAASSRLTPVTLGLATLLLAGDTLLWPCISWCRAEQKSVQYMGTIPALNGIHFKLQIDPGRIRLLALLAFRMA